MKIPVVLFLLVTFSVACVAQDTTYYKELDRSFQVDEKNAIYMEVVSQNEDSVLSYMLSQYPRGKPMDEKHYRGGYPVGVWRSYNRRGKLMTVRNFDKLVYGKCEEPPLQSEKVKPDSLVIQVLPLYKGGEEELYKFVGQAIRYPPEALDADISGRVILEGLVTEDGKWETQKVCLSAHPYLDFEAWRVLELMADWTPGSKNGLPVKVKYRLPVNFKIK